MQLQLSVVAKSIGLLATSLMAASLAAADSENSVDFLGPLQVAFETDTRQWITSDKLQVNVDNRQRFVVPNKCEGDGEEELRHLSARASVEEAYLYIPSACLWLETGNSESSTTVRLDADFVLDVLEHHDEIVLYHTHVGTPAGVAELFPAYSDLLGLILMNARYLERPEFNIRHKAITPLGIIEYAFSVSPQIDQLIAKLHATGLGRHVAQNLAYEFSRQDHQKRYIEAIEACDRITHGHPDHLAECFPMRTEDFALDFQAAPDQLAGISER